LADLLRKKRPMLTMAAAERLGKTEGRSTAATAREMFALQIKAHLASEGMA
jgi:hypothetical protein